MTDVHFYPLSHAFDISENVLETVAKAAGTGKAVLLIEVIDSEENRLFFADIAKKSDEELKTYAKSNAYPVFSHNFYNDLTRYRDLSRKYGVTIKPIDTCDARLALAEDTAFTTSNDFMNRSISCGGGEALVSSTLVAYALYLILRNRLSQLRNDFMIKKSKEYISASPESTFVVINGFNHINEIKNALQNDKKIHTSVLDRKYAASIEAGVENNAIAAITALMPDGSSDNFIDEVRRDAVPIQFLLIKYLPEIRAAFHKTEGQAALPYIMKALIVHASTTLILLNRHLDDKEKRSETASVRFFMEFSNPEKISLQVAENMLLRIGPLVHDIRSDKDIRSSTILEAFKDLFIVPALNENLRKAAEQKSKVC